MRHLCISWALITGATWDEVASQSILSSAHVQDILQIAACAMHRSGALLLEPRDGDSLDERLQRCAASAGAAPSHAPCAHSHMHFVCSRHMRTILKLAK